MKKSHILFAGTMVWFILSAAGCKNGFATKANSMDINSDTRAYAEQQFNAAYEEIHSLVNSKCRSAAAEDVDPEDMSTWSDADKLEAMAWLGILQDNASETEKLVKDLGIYKDVMNIVKKYDLENCVEIRNTAAQDPSRSISKTTVANSTKTGDIFLSHSYDSSQNGSSVAMLNALTRGYYKHAGVIDKRISGDACILSASNNNDHFDKNKDSGLGAVGYEYISSWTSSGIAVGVARVKNATTSQCNAALDAGKKFIGKPYGLNLDRSSDSSFYCSKVVYRSWLTQGYDLEYNTWYFARGLFVTPQDLYDDSDTIYVCGDKPQ